MLTWWLGSYLSTDFRTRGNFSQIRIARGEAHAIGGYSREVFPGSERSPELLVPSYTGGRSCSKVLASPSSMAERILVTSDMGMAFKWMATPTIMAAQ